MTLTPTPDTTPIHTITANITSDGTHEASCTCEWSTSSHSRLRYRHELARHQLVASRENRAGLEKALADTRRQLAEIKAQRSQL